ncbi:YchJ family protein [Streptomyces sp. NPDC059740]|uniref:YchJ family protein n=1 Tax=Streptomyces sp. NPDC059740 TaxID=3346926 RepID=UPI00364E39FE
MSRSRKPSRSPGAPSRAAGGPLSPAAPCPCGLPAAYGDCCGACHTGRRVPSTPEALMRSRYAAFAVRDADYLLATWHPDTRPATLDLDEDVRWTGLEILATTGGTAFHQEGRVEFRAHWTSGGRQGEQREDSRFVRVAGRWLYLDGESG